MQGYKQTNFNTLSRVKKLNGYSNINVFWQGDDVYKSFTAQAYKGQRQVFCQSGFTSFEEGIKAVEAFCNS